MSKVIVIGGGAAGLMAAYSSANCGNQVVLLEKNEKLGKKLYITGKGRCNLTNDTDIDDFISNVSTNPKFILSAIHTFTPTDTMDFFEYNGLSLKVERGKRVFPLSDKSSDVIKTLEKACLNNGVKICLNTEVEDVVVKDNAVYSIITNNEEILCDSIIVCTGGISYPLTGSTGDGYKFAKKLGHNITPLKSALVGIDLKGDFYKKVQGLSLKNVKLTAFFNDKSIYSEMGEMLFTHFGISGPLVLTCSSIINKKDLNSLTLSLDLKPALTEEVLDKRLLREFKEFSNKNLANALLTLLPKSMIEVITEKACVNPSKKCSNITIEERKRILKTLKGFTMKVKSLRPISEAIVTSGGIDVKNINPKTMESKLIKGLFFAGEVIDVDCFTGGFNIQTAFSTGYLAGKNA